MAHEVESMFSVKQTPWHGLGKIVNDAGSASEAIQLAGLDWQTEKRPIFIPTDDLDYSKIQGKFANVRKTDQNVLGIVGKNYKPLQNTEAFNFFDKSIASKELSFETAGSLRGGQHIWILASLKSGPIEVVKNDAVVPFLLLTNGHDGKKAVSVGFTPIRVVCANTLAAAEQNAKTEMIRIHHSNQVVENLDKVGEIINLAKASFEASIEQYQFLASKKVSKKELEKFVKIVFPKNQNKERVEMAEQKMQEAIQKLFETGRGQDIKDTKGTYWALYNATTEFLNYDASRSADARMFNVWMGRSKLKSAQALNVATQMAGGF